MMGYVVLDFDRMNFHVADDPEEVKAIAKGILAGGPDTGSIEVVQASDVTVSTLAEFITVWSKEDAE